MPDLAEAPFVDVFSDDFRADPAATIDELRARSGVVRTPLGCLVVRRHLVQSLLSDARLGSPLLVLARMQGVGDGPLHDMLARSLLELDGADHTRVRRLVSRSFTPRAVDVHRPMMRELVHELVDAFAPTGQCEFMVDFADR